MDEGPLYSLSHVLKQRNRIQHAFSNLDSSSLKPFKYINFTIYFFPISICKK